MRGSILGGEEWKRTYSDCHCSGYWMKLEGDVVVSGGRDEVKVRTN